MANIKIKGRNVSSYIGDAIKKAASEKAEKWASQKAEFVSEIIADNERSLGFFNVTGNLLDSIGVVALKSTKNSGRFKIIDAYSPMEMIGDRPTRQILKKGEAYDKNTYFGGDEVPTKKKQYEDMDGRTKYMTVKYPYIGETDKGYAYKYGSKAKQALLQRLESTTSASKNSLVRVFVFASVPYASFVDKKHSMKLSESLKELLKIGAKAW